MFAGPALGGVLLALSGPGAVFVLTAATFAWSAACLLGIPRDTPPDVTAESHSGQLVAGFRAIMLISAALALGGAASAWLLIRSSDPNR